MYTSFLLLPGSYDDDPGSKRDAERARYEKDPETKGQNTTQTLNRSKTLKDRPVGWGGVGGFGRPPPLVRTSSACHQNNLFITSIHADV